MTWLRNIPFGYRMEQAEIASEPAEAETVRRIFTMYLAGHSLAHIAEAMMEQSVHYHKDEPRWNKNMVKRILDNRRYLGDAEYPRLVSDEDFLNAQLLKADKNVYLPCPPYIVHIKRKLVCGVCGAEMIRLSLGQGAARWKCKNPSCQCAVHFFDEELRKRVDECFRAIMREPEMLVECEAAASPVTADALRLENELTAAFNRGVERAEYMKALIFAVAAEKYKQVPDYTLLHRLGILRERIETGEMTEQLKQELMDAAVQSIRLGYGNTVSMQLVNGRTVTSEEVPQ